MKKLMVLAMVGLLIGCFAVGSAMSATWYTCTISQCDNTSYGFSVVTLTDVNGTFTNVPFFLDTALPNYNAMVAAALTGIANSSNVTAFLNGIGAYDTCYGFGVLK
jgi:hypothetical protein